MKLQFDPMRFHKYRFAINCDLRRHRRNARRISKMVDYQLKEDTSRVVIPGLFDTLKVEMRRTNFKRGVITSICVEGNIIHCRLPKQGRISRVR